MQADSRSSSMQRD